MDELKLKTWLKNHVIATDKGGDDWKRMMLKQLEEVFDSKGAVENG